MKPEDLDKLNLVSKELERKDNLARLVSAGQRRQQPGSRPDGGMAMNDPPMNVVDRVQNALRDWHRIIDEFERNKIQLESKIAQLNAQLDAERDARSSLEKMLAQINDLVTPK